MKVIQINTSNRSQTKKFSQFSPQLYDKNPYWVPPFSSELKLVMNREKHPFYQHSDADFLLVEEDNQVLGRVAILHNKNYCAHHHENVAFFYYYESINDQQVTNKLFEAAREWAKQKGLSAIIGSRGFLRSNGIGILVDGFDSLPAVGIPYNHPYYDQLLQNAGFFKETDYLSGYMVPTDKLPEKIIEAAIKIKEKGNFWVKIYRSINELKPLIPVVDQVHHDAFQNNPGYYPNTPSEFELMAKNILAVANPKLMRLIMQGDQLAGFIIAYPNINKALQKTKGEIFPFGWLTILKALKSSKIIDLNGVGLMPQFQGRGANILLYYEVEQALRAYQAERIEIVQVDERNFKSKSDMENMGVKWNKRHRLYRMVI